MATNKPIVNSAKYVNKYVALRNFDNPNVVSYGIDPIRVFKNAVKKGVKNPVLFFVPGNDTVHVY